MLFLKRIWEFLIGLLIGVSSGNLDINKAGSDFLFLKNNLDISDVIVSHSDTIWYNESGIIQAFTYKDTKTTKKVCSLKRGDYILSTKMLFKNRSNISKVFSQIFCIFIDSRGREVKEYELFFKKRRSFVILPNNILKKIFYFGLDKDDFRGCVFKFTGGEKIKFVFKFECGDIAEDYVENLDKIKKSSIIIGR